MITSLFIRDKNCYPEYNVPTHGCLKRWVKKEKIILLNCGIMHRKSLTFSML
jgi:hypothetical protein